MDEIRCPIVELRQYTLHPGQLDVLIDLFDREFVETQEAVGMAVLGQFRDLDDPDRFVWLRGFDDMPSRGEALTAFYGGPTWQAYGPQAAATMIDADDVLLLRPATGSPGFPVPAAVRAPAGHATPPPSAYLATLCYRDHPFDEEFTRFFEHQVRAALAATGAAPVAWLQTEYAENNFPSLPIRTGEHVFAWFSRFDSPADLDDHLRQVDESDHWRAHVFPALSATLTARPQHLRLAPTARSLLR